MIHAELFIPIIPVAKGRPKFFRRGSFVGTYTPKKTMQYEAEIKNMAILYATENGIKPFPGPLSAEVSFYLPRPKSHTKKQRETAWHTSRPDVDNLLKAVYDAVQGILFMDDSQICLQTTYKVYADPQEPGVSLRLETL